MAPPKTDKESEKEAQQLKKLLSLARKGPINFGISLGKKQPEDLAFLAHKTKNPKSLRKKAREETGNSKGAHGEMTVDGKNLVFACEENPPGPIVKAMRIFLRELKVPLRPEFIGPDEVAGSAKAARADDADDEEAAPRRARAAASEAEPASDGAEAAPAEGAEGSEADAAKEEWDRRHEKVRLASVKVLKAGLGDSDKIRAVLSFAQGKAETGDHAAGLRALGNLEKLLVRAIKDKAGIGAGEIAAGIVEKRKFLVTRWQQVPGEIKVEIGKLEKAIGVQVPDEDPAELCRALDSAFGALIAEVQSAIDDAINAGDPDYATAREVIEQQKKALLNHEIVQLLKRNPLISGQQFEDSVIKALDDVRDALAA